MIQKNNKGFSLIEVIVAMAILSLVVSPLLHAFVSAARTNAKARDLLNATTIAENMVEELKASSLEIFSEDEITQIKGDDGTTRHHFSVTESIDGVEYLVEGDAVERTSTIAKIHSMDEEDCGYYAEPENMHKLVAEEFYRKHLAYSYSALEQRDSEALSELMTRDITIKIEQNAENKTVVTYNCNYTLPRGYVADSDRTYTVSQCLYDESVKAEPLDSIYVYFYPMDQKCKDTIQIENMKNVDVDLYLNRMAGEGRILDLHLLEGSAQNKTESNTRICTNMVQNTDYNMGQGSSIARFFTLGGEEKTVNRYDVDFSVSRNGDVIHTYSGSIMED